MGVRVDCHVVLKVAVNHDPSMARDIWEAQYTVRAAPGERHCLTSDVWMPKVSSGGHETVPMIYGTVGGTPAPASTPGAMRFNLKPRFRRGTLCRLTLTPES